MREQVRDFGTQLALAFREPADIPYISTPTAPAEPSIDSSTCRDEQETCQRGEIRYLKDLLERLPEESRVPTGRLAMMRTAAEYFCTYVGIDLATCPVERLWDARGGFRNS